MPAPLVAVPSDAPVLGDLPTPDMATGPSTQEQGPAPIVLIASDSSFGVCGLDGECH